MNPRNPWPRRFPLSRVRFNPPGAWPNAELRHDNVMTTLRGLSSRLSIARYHFHLNEDGTITPHARAHEWQLAALLAMGRKTFRLTS